MHLTKALLFGLLLSLFIGLAYATESSDTLDELNKLDDALTGLEIITEGNKDLQELQEDPTNATRLKDAIEKPFDIMLGGDIHDSERVKNYMYGLIIFAFIGTILSLLLPMLNR